MSGLYNEFGLDADNFNEFIDDGAFNINNLIKKTEDDVFALDDLVTNDKVAKKLTVLFESVKQELYGKASNNSGLSVNTPYSKTKASLRELNRASRAFADSSISNIFAGQGGSFFLIQ